MKEGDHAGVVDSIITSPPYAESLQSETEEQTRRKQERIAKSKAIHDGRALEKPSPGKAALGGGYGVSEGQLGAMKEGDFEGVVNGVITSPPYPEVISTGERRDVQKAIDAEERYLKAHPELKGQRPKLHVYGDSKGQIGHLREGNFEEVKAVITSPPFVDVHRGKYGNGIELAKLQRASPGQRRDKDSSWYKTFRAQSSGYSDDPANMGNLPEGSHEAVVDAVVTSPPYEAVQKRDRTSEEYMQRPESRQYLLTIGRRGARTGYKGGESNIGNEQGATYWGAVKDVYCECLKALKPGGVMAVVVKSFIRKGKIIDLPSQTLELLEAIGFEPLERIRAWMVSPVTQKSLMPDMVEDYTKARKSFFRRLAERKGSPKIDFEEVLVVRKPISDCH